jgi:hypothetical protein
MFPIGIAPRYGPDKGSIPGRADVVQTGIGVCPSLLSNAYRGLFPWRKSGRSEKLIVHLHLIPNSGIVELYLQSSIYLHGVDLN